MYFNRKFNLKQEYLMSAIKSKNKGSQDINGVNYDMQIESATS